MMFQGGGSVKPVVDLGRREGQSGREAGLGGGGQSGRSAPRQRRSGARFVHGLVARGPA